MKGQPHPNPARILSTLLPTSIAVSVKAGACEQNAMWAKSFVLRQLQPSSYWHPTKSDIDCITKKSIRAGWYKSINQNIHNYFADSQYKTKQHWEYCNDF